MSPNIPQVMDTITEKKIEKPLDNSFYIALFHSKKELKKKDDHAWSLLPILSKLKGVSLSSFCAQHVDLKKWFQTFMSTFVVLVFVALSAAINTVQSCWRNLRYESDLWVLFIYGPFLLTIVSSSVTNDVIVSKLGLTLVPNFHHFRTDFILLTLFLTIPMIPIYTLSALTNGETTNEAYGEGGCTDVNGCEERQCPGAIHIVLSMCDYFFLQTAAVTLMLINNSLEKKLKERLHAHYLYVSGDGGLSDIARVADHYIMSMRELIRLSESWHIVEINDHIGFFDQHSSQLTDIIEDLKPTNSFGISAKVGGQQISSLQNILKLQAFCSSSPFHGHVEISESEFSTILFNRMSKALKEYGDDVNNTELWKILRFSISAEQLFLKLNRYVNQFGSTYADKFSFSEEIKTPHAHDETDSDIGGSVRWWLSCKAYANLSCCLLTLVVSHIYTKNSDENVGFILLIVLFSSALNLSTAKVVNTQEMMAKKVELSYGRFFLRKKGAQRIIGLNLGTQTYYYAIVISSLLTLGSRFLKLGEDTRLDTWLECLRP